ncbi:MAG: hypothetical protein H6R13_2729 [Proteobacteria bacterium]|nr:hypothetical protein [Pseudomonadota bacterium]
MAECRNATENNRQATKCKAPIGNRMTSFCPIRPVKQTKQEQPDGQTKTN